jgi:hypothetical protein
METQRRPLIRIRGYFYPTGHTPEEVFQAIGKLRREAQAEVDRLIAFLDATDGDADLEPDNDAEPEGDEEPSLGWTTVPNQAARSFHGPLSAEPDLEDEHDGGEPDHEGEDSGSLDAEIDQVGWARGGDSELEPSLGWTVDGVAEIDESRWTATDGEIGDLPIAALDQRRAEFRVERHCRGYHEEVARRRLSALVTGAQS